MQSIYTYMVERTWRIVDLSSSIVGMVNTSNSSLYIKIKQQMQYAFVHCSINVMYVYLFAIYPASKLYTKENV